MTTVTDRRTEECVTPQQRTVSFTSNRSMKWHDQAELTIHSRLCAVLRMGPHDVRYLREDRTLTNCFVADLYNVTCSSGCHRGLDVNGTQTGCFDSNLTQTQ